MSVKEVELTHEQKVSLQDGVLRRKIRDLKFGLAYVVFLAVSMLPLGSSVAIDTLTGDGSGRDVIVISSLAAVLFVIGAFLAMDFVWNLHEHTVFTIKHADTLRELDK